MAETFEDRSGQSFDDRTDQTWDKIVYPVVAGSYRSQIGGLSELFENIIYRTQIGGRSEVFGG